MTPGASHYWPQGDNLNKLGKGPQMLHIKALRLMVSDEKIFFHIFSIYYAKKETPHVKHTLYMGVFHKSLANDLSQSER